MKKYIKMPMQMYAGSTATNPAVLESGTTTAAAELKVTDSAATFVANNVEVGDYVVITTGISGYPNRSYAIVTGVDSETVLSISAGSGAPASGTGGLSASGTVYSVVAAADAYKAVLSGVDFRIDIRPGDLLFNSTSNLITKVDKVLSATELLLDNPVAVLVGDSFFVISQNGNGCAAVSLDNVSNVNINNTNGQVTLHYKTSASSLDKCVIALGQTVVASNETVFGDEFYLAVEEAWSSKWTNVGVEMPMTSTGGGNFALQWTASVTYS